MIQTEIHIAVAGHNVLIVLPGHQSNAEAFLLSSAGEERERFLLHSGHNNILLKHHQPGTYALRIETDKDVTVKQIILSVSL